MEKTNRIWFCCTFAVFHLVSSFHTGYFRTSLAGILTASRTQSVKCSCQLIIHLPAVFKQVLLILTVSRLGSLFCEPTATQVRVRLCLKQTNGPVRRMSLKLISSNPSAVSRDPFNKLRLLRASPIQSGFQGWVRLKYLDSFHVRDKSVTLI